LKSHDTIWSKEHQTQLDQHTKVNKISLDTIEYIRTKIDDIKSEHNIKLVVSLEEKDKLSKNHENQVETLVFQLNEMKIKMKNLEALRKEAVELNKKLTSLQESFYAKLYEIKEQHEQVLPFTA
jgi:hypothetical protein